MPPLNLVSPFPAGVAFSVVHGPSDDDPLDPRAALDPREEALLHPRTTHRRVASFRMGRRAAHAALHQLGMPAGPVLRGDHREPLWPPGVVGSITHTAGYAVAAVALAEAFGGIGVDLERRRPMTDVKDQIVFGEERSSLEGLAEPELSDRIVAMFSAKESVYKAFFPRIGAFFGFDAVSLQPAAGGFHAGFTSRLDERYPPDRGFLVRVDWYPELVLTGLALPPDD